MRTLPLAALLAFGVGPFIPAAEGPLGAPQAAILRAPSTGEALAAELGCGACHAGAPAPTAARRRAPALGPGGPPRPAAFVFEYLGGPVRRGEATGATRMPDFRLDEGERLALALFLGGGGGTDELAQARRRHPTVDAALGARIYGALGCAGCHAGVGGAGPVAGPDLSREGARVRPGWLADWLRSPAPVRGPAHPTAPGARMPDFRLTQEEAGALAAWLESTGSPSAQPPDRPLPPTEARRVDRWLESRGACLGCHRIGGRGGRIGPALENAADRLRPSFVLETLLDPSRAAAGSPMPHQPLGPELAEGLARRILDLSSGARDGGAPPSALSLADPAHPAWTALPPAPGQGGSGAPALYARHCAACHGSAGRGDGWNAPELPSPPARHDDAGTLGLRADDTLYDGIHAGGWVMGGSGRMPPFGALLSPVEIRSLVEHVRTLCACTAPAWSRGAGRGPS